MGVNQSNRCLPIDGTSVWVKFEDDWFAQGVSRLAYRGTYHGDLELEGEMCVVKLYKEQWCEMLGEVAYKADIRASFKAHEMAQIFNRKHRTNKPIQFVLPKVSKIDNSAAFKFLGFIRIPRKVKGKLAGTKASATEMIPKGASVAIERYLEGEYVKFLSNSSYVNHNVAAFLPAAFSHFTFHESRGSILVCDLQGVRGQRSYVFTDPAIHSLNKGIGFYGPTDLGVFGMIKFFQNHHCNPLCRGFVTPDLSNIPRDAAADVNRVLQAIRVRNGSTFTHELQGTGVGLARLSQIQEMFVTSQTNGANTLIRSNTNAQGNSSRTRAIANPTASRRNIRRPTPIRRYLEALASLGSQASPR
ncbi:alpha-protein kinase vwkA-like [Patiria miniata]|uniref:Alpha-type protein kinase domain-containing protein n=1 Tax=Patiria miniata TaxID=46514 RepID=A0A914AFJ5_PATMI|nr:alpha-protein kinase vwkA-like [Patiria miniata]XP_038062745.1 alpha-protein kinase vwkA-like [Patiria miniata]